VRVGLIIYGGLDQASGGYLYDRNLVEHLRQHGDHVEIISLPWRNYLRHLTDNFSSSLLDQIKSLNLDILLQDELNHPSLFLLNRRIKKHSSLPIISIVHHLRSSEQHPAFFKLFYRLIEHAYLRSVHGFVFNSHTTRQVVEIILRATTKHVVAQPAGDRLAAHISDDEIRARALQPGPLQVLFLGNLIPRKATHLLLHAAASLPAADFHFSFAGSPHADPHYAAQLARLVTDLGLSQRVDFLGHLADAEVASRLRVSHVLVLPSSYEGYGIAYLEGMGFGLPAIGTRAGAAGELISHGQDGYLIDVGNADQLAGHLRTLHADRDLLAQLGIAARRRYEQHPTWQESLAKIRNFLFNYNQPSLLSSSEDL
jgi:glycosyltransferase involved in cell wall biosynthesis